jgi:hypothetical protein
MIDLIEIKSLILNDLIDKRAEKKIKQRINYENYKQKNNQQQNNSGHSLNKPMKKPFFKNCYIKNHMVSY